MIARVWRGWMKAEDADNYEKLLQDVVYPGLQAIKCVRIAYGVGLKEVKDIEQSFERSQNVKNPMASANVESAKGGLKWLLLIAAIGLVFYCFFTINHRVCNP